MSETARIAVLRLSGEVSTKAPATRQRFVTRLVANVKDALQAEGVAGSVERSHERLYVELGQQAPGPTGADLEERGAEALARVFGVQSVSLASRVRYAALDDLVATATARFRDAVAGRSFAVRARRIGPPVPGAFRRRALEQALGSALLADARGVDLEHPEVTVRIELHRGVAHLFEEVLPGPAGLPLGTQGRAVALMSGGFDSAVAAWQLLRRGVRLDYVFCNLGGSSHELGVLRVLQVLTERWSYGARPRLHALDFRPVVENLQRHGQPRLWQIVLKREMLRAAEGVARSVHAEAIVTGEAVGQVSSQTLPNLATISQATTLPILRPLVGMNKDEIIRSAEAIGTAQLSAVVAEYCAIVPRKPATAARLEDVLRDEARRDDAVVATALEAREVLELRGLDPEARVMPELAIEEVPEGSILVDLRTRREYDAWHAPDALQLDFATALAAFSSFSKEQHYVLTCEYGLKSAHLAERMREAGLRAHHFRGGTRALRRFFEKQDR